MKAKMVRVPVDLCDRIDKARGDVPRDRWVRRTLEEALGAGSREGSGDALPSRPVSPRQSGPPSVKETWRR